MGSTMDCLGIPRRRLAVVEDGSRPNQRALNRFCDWVRATEHAPRDPFRVFKHCHGLAELVERGGGVLAERIRVTP